MITSTGFYYDGEYSGYKGVIKVRTSGGLSTDTFLSTVTNQTVKTKNNIKSHIQSTENESLAIPMALYFEDNLDDTSIRGVKKWLSQSDFKELIFEDQPDKVYYAKIDGATDLSHNSIASGYIEFEFLTNSAYTFSPLIVIEGESESATEFQDLLIHNEGDLFTLPKITINIPSSNPTDIEIQNNTTDESLLITDNLENEIIIIWNEYEEFETSSIIRHVYDDHNGGFITIAEGLNELFIRGIFTYTIEYQHVYL